MTRPMPYVPLELVDGYTKHAAYARYRDPAGGGFLLGRQIDEKARAKRLTDAECAAEKWHAKFFAMIAAARLKAGDRRPEIAIAGKLQFHEADAWERFAAHPHAHEADPCPHS